MITLLVLLVTAAPLRAQPINPVYVDDAPEARALLEQARAQMRDNPGEAARIFVRLLEQSGRSLTPVTIDATDQFVAIRTAVLRALADDQRVRDRYRLVASGPARRMLEAGELRRLALAHPLTTDGLEALVRMGQAAVEAGHAGAARRWLGEAIRHPDLTDRQYAHVWSLLGHAAILRSDRVAWEEALVALEELGPLRDGGAADLPARLASELRARWAEPTPPLARPAVDLTDAGSATPMPDVVGEPIWSVRLEGSLLDRSQGERRPDDLELEGQRRSAALATAAPTVRGNVVYVNEGLRLQALDRFTGRERWSIPLGGVPTAGLEDPTLALDLNLVTVAGDTLVSLLGHAQNQTRSATGRVVCLSATSGRRRWMQDLDGIGGVADHEGLHPIGAPVVTDGHVILLARKVNAQRLASVYLVALDEADGELAWSQYLGSSAAVGQAARPTSSMILRDGGLFVASPIGVIASVDPSTGLVRWLRRYQVPVRVHSSIRTRRAWEFSTPVLTARGLVAITPDQQRVVLLDRRTGDELESHAAAAGDAWGGPAYLLGDDGWVYAVGDEVRAFTADNLAAPLWQRPRSDAAAVSTVDDRDRPEGTPPAASAAETLELRGRAQLSGEVLLLPVGDALLVVDRETGQDRFRLPVRGGGNPLAADAQIFLAGVDVLDAYMSFEQARRMLADRLDAAPDGLDPGLSLVRLGLQARRLGLATDAADELMRRLERREPGDELAAAARTELFEMLLAEAERLDADLEPAPGDRLHAIIGRLADGSERRARHLLAFGRFLAAHDPGRATAALLGIVDDPLLAIVPHERDGVVRIAGQWALRDVAVMLEDGPAGLAGTLEDDAAAVRRAVDDRPDPALLGGLLDLARRRPMTEVGRAAAFDAADRLARNGRPGEALSLLLEVARPIAADEAAAVLARAADLARDEGWSRLAGSIDGATGPGSPEPPRRPRVGEFAPEATVALDGAIVPLRHDHAPHRAGGPDDPRLVLLARAGTVRCLDAGSLTPTWERTVGDPAPELLEADDDGVLLWLGSNPDDPRVVHLDRRDGTERWSTPDLDRADILGDAATHMRRTRAGAERMASGEPFIRGETIPLVGSTHLALVQRTGGVALFDLADASEPIAVLTETLDEVHAMALLDHALVLAGLVRPEGEPDDTAAMLARAMSIDPVSGEVLASWNLPDAPLWLRTGPLGRAVIGTSVAVDAYDPISGERSWRRIGLLSPVSGQAWAAPDQLIVLDQETDARGLTWDGTGLTRPYDLNVRRFIGSWRSLHLRRMIVEPARRFALFEKRLIVFEPDGSIVGADVVTDGGRTYFELLRGDDRLAVIGGTSEQVRVGDRGGGRRLSYAYRVYFVAEDGRLLSRPLALSERLERLEAARLVDGWLLMSFRDETVAFALPADAPNPP